MIVFHVVYYSSIEMGWDPVGGGGGRRLVSFDKEIGM